MAALGDLGRVMEMSEAIKAIADFTKVPPVLREAYVFTQKDRHRDPQGIPSAGVIQAHLDLVHELGHAGGKLDVKRYLDTSNIKP